MPLKMQQERLIRKWTLKFIGQKIGVTPETIHYIETGQRRPSFDILVKLEDLFGMDYRNLFDLPPRQTPDNTKEPDGNQV